MNSELKKNVKSELPKNMKSELLVQIEESIETIRSITSIEPEIGIILGTGLGGLAAVIENRCSIAYDMIPHFPVSTVESHHGNLIFGEISGRRIMAMQGRFHFYEGYSMKKITYPVRLMKKMGINTLLISNACGSLNPYFRKGSIMLIDDHINLLPDNPLIGPNEDEFGPRFPDMSQPYSKRLIDLAEKIALENKIKLHKGVFTAMTGPSLETRAEYRFLRFAGADVVGMSTIPECIVARHCGMEVAGFSIITDECYPECLKPVSLDEMVESANKTEPFLTKLMVEMIGKI